MSKSTEPTDRELAKRVEEERIRYSRIRIMGKTIDEVCVILNGLELEKITEIEVTMNNLNKLYKMLVEDIKQSNMRAMHYAVSDITNKTSKS